MSAIVHFRASKKITLYHEQGTVILSRSE